MNIAVIFAGGVGSRMHSKDRPKQFLEMYNKPIIIHTLEYFENHSMIDAIVVVCIKDWIPYLNKLLYKFRIEKVKSVVPGGETGQLSIYNGLKSAKQIAKDEKSIVLIHDGVRPLINEKVISDNIQSVIKYGSAITTAKVKETILVVNEGTATIDYVPSRNNSRVAKAPQSFWLDDILKAHEKALSEGEKNCIDSCTMMQRYGYYNAAVKIKVILVSVVTSLGTVLLPRASYYIQRGELKEFHRITRKALNFVFLMATPLFVYFIYFAKEGIFFLSGNNYVGSIIPMQVIMPTLLLIGITNILGIQILVPTGREKIVLYSEIVGAVVDVIINALLIPVYASTGAAIGTLVAEFAVFVVQFYALKDEILNTFRQIHYIKILIALSVGSIVSLWVKILNLECFFSLVISSLLFFGAYGFVLLILKEELFLEIFNTIKNKII